MKPMTTTFGVFDINIYWWASWGAILVLKISGHWWLNKQLPLRSSYVWAEVFVSMAQRSLHPLICWNLHPLPNGSISSLSSSVHHCVQFFNPPGQYSIAATARKARLYFSASVQRHIWNPVFKASRVLLQNSLSLSKIPFFMEISMELFSRFDRILVLVSRRTTIVSAPLADQYQ